MAEKEFRTGDDALLVVTEGDTVGFITRGHDQEELDHDEVRELIEFLQDIVGEGLTMEQLDMMPVGHEVYDVDGDKWTKEQYGLWRWGGLASPRTAQSLVDTYGPVRKVG